jgi:U3 small nucleolar RNA-associated protein MPP10
LVVSTTLDGRSLKHSHYPCRLMAPLKKKSRSSAPEYIATAGGNSSDDDDLNAVLNYGKEDDEGNIGLDDEYSDDGAGLYSDEEEEEEEDDDIDEEDGDDIEEEISQDEDFEDGESFHGVFDDGDPNDIAQEDDDEDVSDEDDDSDKDVSDEAPEQPQRLGALARRLAQLEEEISNIETQQVSDKHWTMTGEVSAKNRPVNSLLEANVELPFGHMASKRLDESVDLMVDDFDAENPDKPKFDIDLIIRQRVADGTFDDIIKRKIETVLVDNKPRDQYEGLDFEKSQLGLAEVYAKQYEKDIFNQSEETEKSNWEKEEAKKVFAKLMHKLDCLTNYNFAPRPPVIRKGDVKDLPAMKLEEPIPLIVSSSLRANKSHSF